MATTSTTPGSRIAGIDLGTTNSCVAVFEQGRAKVLNDPSGASTVPSIVSLAEDNTWIVGSLARARLTTHPTSTVQGIKRIMGRRHDSPECLRYAEQSPLRLDVTPQGLARVRIGDGAYGPEEISAIILDQLHRNASQALGEPISRAVVTVPAYFDDAQRHATRNAGRIAGLDVMRILNEPTAAALAYRLANERDGIVAIYDLGGGTFDVSILEIDSGVFQVRAIAGDSYLGGIDFDWKIASWAMDKFASMYGVDPRHDPEAVARVLLAAEECKKVLSAAKEAPIAVPALVRDGATNLHMDLLCTRKLFEDMSASLVERTLACCRRALEDAKIKPGDIDWVIFVGGQTRMPYVASRVTDVLGKQPLKGINPDEVVAMGAAVMAGLLAGQVKDIVLIDALPHTLGFNVKGRMRPLIARNSPVPADARHTFAAPAGQQGNIRLELMQGESENAAENRSLATVELRDLPPAPAAGPRVEVHVHVDANGIVGVEAKDLLTGKIAQKHIRDASFLSEEELSRMTHDMVAYRHAHVERIRRAADMNRAAGLLARVDKLTADGADDLWGQMLAELGRELHAIVEGGPGQKLETIEERLKTLESQLADIS